MRCIFTIVAAILLMGQAEPPAPPVPSGASALIAKPVWIRKPTDEDYARAYPPRAKGLVGMGNLECTVTQSGGLEACEVADYPRKLGFGDAALSLAGLYQLRETDGDGLPVAGRRVKLQVILIKPTS